LKIKSEQNSRRDERRVRNRRAISPEHPKQNRRDHRDGNDTEDAPQAQRCPDQLAEAKSILPHAPANRGDAAAHAIVREQIHGGLHGVRNGEQRVFRFRQRANKKDSGGER
jgi:hypothetical protein